MDRVSVSSSNVVSVGYDAGSSTLEVEFKDGSIYQYHSVPSEHFDAMLSAESVGKYLNANIKHKYRYTKV